MVRRRTIIAVVIAALSACSGGDSGGTLTAGKAASSPFGMHEVRFTNKAVDEGAAMREIGATAARIAPYGSLVWDQIETVRGVYDWTASDAVIGAGYAAGIKLFVGAGAQNRLDGTPPGPGRLPNDMDWYLEFLRRAVERYDGDGVDDAPGSPKIEVVQIGNEIDGPAFWQDTPENYALLLKRSYQTIKEAAPDMQVAIGGVATPAGYYAVYRPILAELDRTKDKPGDRSFDVFDLHWSGQFAGEDDYDVISLPSGTYDLRDLVADIRSDLAASGGADVPVYITEMSDYSDTPAGYPSHSEAYHAAAIVKRFVFALAAGIDRIFWSELVEAHDAGGVVNGYFDNVGLINNPANADGYSHKKLGYYAYRKMTEILAGSDGKDVRVVQDADAVRVYRFAKGGRTVYAGWWDCMRTPGYAPGMTRTVAVTDVPGRTVTVTGAVPHFTSGRDVAEYAAAFTVQTLPVSNGTFTLTLAETPVFVEVVP